MQRPVSQNAHGKLATLKPNHTCLWTARLLATDVVNQLGMFTSKMQEITYVGTGDITINMIIVDFPVQI